MGFSSKEDSKISLYTLATVGYGKLQGTIHGDGDFTQARLAFGVTRKIAKIYSKLDSAIGLEFGVQNGNEQRLFADDDIIADAGGLPLQTTLKPMFDIMAVLEIPFYSSYLMLKGGIVYRQLAFEDRSSSQDHLDQVNGKFEVGLGYNVTPYVSLVAFYQGIYNAANNATVNLNAEQDLTISSIPTQQGWILRHGL